MSTTNYYSIHGQIIGEKTAGSSRVDYLTDALGSVTATVDQSANVINTYRYKPYGGLLAKTGGGSDPAFQWVGSQGYRNTGKAYSDVYIRQRHYSSGLGRWANKDAKQYDFRNILNKYLYIKDSPTTLMVPMPPAPAQLWLTITPLGVPTTGGFDCGFVEHSVQWKLSSRATGWLIQHVFHNANIVSTDRPPRRVALYTCEYWEAWQFINGEFQAPGDQDRFQRGNWGELTSGHQGIRGTLMWYEGMEKPPGGWVRSLQDICPPRRIYAGELWWRTWAIPGWRDITPPTHYLSAGWHCCDPNDPLGCKRQETQTAWEPRYAGSWPLAKLG